MMNIPLSSLYIGSTPSGNVPKYHDDTSCNRGYHNTPEKRSLRAIRYNELLQTGINFIPNEQTAYCPEAVENWEVSEFGHDTKVLFENEATTPVVLVWLKNGVEYSALRSEITPPQADPSAILQPGEWASVDAFEGHVFYVRELTKEGGLGDILLQHQPGMVAVRNRFGKKLPCEKPKLPTLKDLERLPPKKQEEVVKQALDKVDPEPKVRKMGEEKTDPNWERSQNHWKERCNIIYKGFRNEIDGCAVNMFYVGMQEPIDGPMICREEFKFHLGLHPAPQDYMHSWESRTKFEGTFVGHSWVARLASNIDTVVDTYTVAPLYVRDCPNLKQKQQVHLASAQIDAVGQANVVGGAANVTQAMMNNITAKAAQANVHSI
jgi:hypothetical protein